MKYKILCIFVMMLLTSSVVFAMEKTVKTEIGLDDPPKDIDWTSNSNNVADWIGMDITADGYHGRVDSVEDTNGDGKLGYCDYVIINWINLKTRQPYWKYHCEKGEYVDDPQDPDYGRWKFEFDYNSKSRSPPKIKNCCHYVDDDNTGGPWDGSFENPYRHFQDAINAASPGDHVIGLPGSYNENIVIDKPLVLRRDIDYFIGDVDVYAGNSGSSTITIIADHVTLCGILVRGYQDWEEGAGIDCYSDYNTFIGNDIYDNVNGIYLHDSANNNIIVENIIHNNDFGVFIWEDSNNNLIYNNIFENNNYFNAKDKCTNNWNYDYPIGGNYWDNYAGTDADGDGIGDTPHPILGEGLNFDDYPKENRTTLQDNGKPLIDLFDGSTSGTKGERYGYAVRFYDDELHDAILEIDWDDGGDIEYSDYLGAGMEFIFEHIWSEEGTYNVKVRAIDMLGAIGDWATLQVTMPKVKNVKPVPFGSIFVFGGSVDVKIVQLEPGEDYVDLEVLNKPLYIWDNEIIPINIGAFVRLYEVKGLFLPSFKLCIGICKDWGIIG